MDRCGKRCVLYSRVSTEMQVDGFSLAGQKTCLTRFVEREEMNIVGEYEDAGKSGKSIEGRPAFKRMLDDIQMGLKVDYVIVYKLSRFGRNAADVLNSLELIQDYGVNLICTDEGIDSSQASGRLLISVLSAVAQIERENILEQTMNGRREKARQGLWNGGMAPYGYNLVDGKLVVDEEQKKIIQLIFNKYADSKWSFVDVANYLNNQGLLKSLHANRKETEWKGTGIAKIISNPIYIGKIEWGHRANTKVKGSREMKRIYTNENIVVADGQHESLIDIDLWNKAQDKRKKCQEYYKSFIPRKGIHVLSGLLVCPVCGSPMSSQVNKRTHSDGTATRNLNYACNAASRGKHSCNHSRTYDEIACEKIVLDAIAKVTSNDAFINSLKNDLHFDANKSQYEEELKNYEKRLKVLNNSRSSLEEKSDNLDFDTPNYQKIKEPLEFRLDKIYNQIFELEDIIDSTKKKIHSFMQEMLSAETIVKALKNFNKFYDLLEPIEQKNVLNALINKIEIYPRDLLDYNIRLKSIEFKIDMFKDTSISDDDGNLNMKNLKKFIKTKSNSIFKTVYFGDEEGQIPLESISFERQTYVSPYTIKKIEENRGKLKQEGERIHVDSNQEIIDFVKNKYNLVVYGKFIRAVKTTLGIKYRKLDKDTINNDLYVPIEKWDAIVDALISLDMIPEELKDNINDIVKEKREEFITNKLNYTKRRRDNNSYIELRKKIKEETGYIVNCNNITEILDLITNYETYIQKPLRTMPHHDRAKEILRYLIEYELVTDEDAFAKFDNLYEVKKNKTLKKKRYNNDDIINYVKEKYKLTINGSMISYVRDKEGIKVKTKDRRFDPTQKNKRIPKQEQYDAIVETTKKFKMISTT